MVTKTTRFGDTIEEKTIFTDTRVSPKKDRFGNTLEEKENILSKFNSTSRTPQKTQEEEGFIEKYIVDPVTAGVAGIGEGIGKIAEGTISLGTILTDLGLGTDLTSKVEKYFDDNKIMQYLENKSDDAWTGTVTSVLTQFGIPGTLALKVASRLSKVAKAGSFAARRPGVTKALLTGVAEGAVSTSDMGTLGDLVGFGPTQTTEDPTAEGREKAFKGLVDKFKFGVEGALGFSLIDNVIFPGGKKLFKGAAPAFKGLIKATGINDNIIKTLEFNPNTGKNELIPRAIDEGFQFNQNNILRWVDKNVLAPFRARGTLPKDVFEANRTKINKLRSVTEKVRGESLELEKAVQKVIDPDAGGWWKQLDKIGVKRRTKLMEDIYDYLTSGKMKSTKIDVNGKIVPKTIDELKAALPDNIPSELLPYISQIRNSIDEMSTSLSSLENFTLKGGADFQSVVANNVGEYLTRSYKMFGTKADRGQWLNTINNTPEGVAIKNKAREYIKKNNPEMADDLVEAELKGLLTEVKEDKVGNQIIKLTKFDDAIRKTRSQVPPELRALLGEVKDPIEQYYKTAAKINTYIEDTKFFETVLKKGKNKYFFEPPKKFDDEAASAVVPTGKGGLEFGTTIISDGPLNGWRTTDEIGSALNKIADSKTNANQLSGLYSKLFLAPKAFTQEAKTTLSPITHARNLISAASFTGMNGNFFRNPAKIAEDFKKAWKMTTAISKNQLESTMGRSLFKDDLAYQSFKNEYMELQELGIVNTSARLGDLAKSLDEVSAGLQNLTEDGKLYTMMRGWGDKTGFTKLRGAARLAYQTEDDVYKIQNFYSEKSKFTDAYEKAYQKNPTQFVKEMADEIARVNPSLTRKEALTDILKIDPSNGKNIGFEKFIKLKAADTVKNNIPNYDYVGSFGQALRKLPVGNFVSFPLEIIRTGINTTRQGLKEVMDPTGYTRGIGLTRLGGVATFGIGLGKGLQEGAQWLTNTSNEQINALREFLPEWSKDSTLIPVKQGGQLYYVDFSHTNAYDTLTQPLRSAMSGFGAARDEGQSILGSFDDAVMKSAIKFASPFVEESIATQFLADVFFRGGASKTGRRLWNPQDDLGTKISNTLAELFRTASPGSAKQLHRLYLSGFGDKDQYNRGFKFINEASGLLGFRIQNPFIEQGINFKIGDNKRTVAESKKLFTSVAYRPNSSTEEIISAYRKANEAKLKNDQVLFKQLRAAKELGMSDREIRKVVGERYSKSEAGKIMNNRFTPIKISDFAYEKIRSNSRERGLGDKSQLIRGQANNIYNSLFNNSIIDDPSSLFKETINIMEGEPLTTSPRGSDAASLSENIGNLFSSSTPTTLSIPNIPNIPISLPTQTRFGDAILNSGDRSQLAKSGNIDITEAIAARRT